METFTRLKVGVIGAGQWGRNVVRTLHALGALGAVAEASPVLRAALRLEYPELKIHEDHQALLGEGLRAVAIATPAPTHYAIAREALLADKDVFVEKPITLTARDAESLARLAEDRQRVLMVGHLLLYQPAIQALTKFIQDGHLGTLYGLHLERLNLGRARAVENALWSFGVHDVAVLLHVVGEEPRQIIAQGQRALQPAVEDDVYLHLDFPSQTKAHLHVSWLWPQKRRRLVAIGSRGMLVYDELAQTVVLHRKGISGDLTSFDQGSEVVFAGAADPLALEMGHFLERLEDRRMPLTNGRHALAVVRVLETASHHLETLGNADPCSHAKYVQPPGGRVLAERRKELDSLQD